MINIYVGNLPYSVADDELKELFEPFGEVLSAKVIIDRENGRSKGFGFVEMGNEEDGQKAISSLNGNDSEGRPLKVNEARPREDNFRGGGGGGGGGGGRGRY